MFHVERSLGVCLLAGMGTNVAVAQCCPNDYNTRCDQIATKPKENTLGRCLGTKKRPAWAGLVSYLIVMRMICESLIAPRGEGNHSNVTLSVDRAYIAARTLFASNRSSIFSFRESNQITRLVPPVFSTQGFGMKAVRVLFKRAIAVARSMEIQSGPVARCEF